LPTSRSVRADALDPELRSLLLSAPIDVGLGPFEVAGGWSVVWLRRRARPDPADPVMRTALEDELLARALDRELIGALKWEGPT
jgi:hypothetical protein